MDASGNESKVYHNIVFLFDGNVTNLTDRPVCSKGS